MRSNPSNKLLKRKTNKDKGEDPDLKKTLKDVIDKWTKLITDMANEYDQRHEDIVMIKIGDFDSNSVFRKIERKLKSHWMILDKEYFFKKIHLSYLKK